MQDLSLIQTFFAFADSANMLEAAKKRGLSQPAITQQLQALEVQLGKELFVFRGKKKVLSPYGKSFYEFLKDEFQQLNLKFQSFLQTSKDLSEVELKIGGRRELLNQFIDSYDLPCKQTYLEHSSESAIENLRKGKIDLAIGSEVSRQNYLHHEIFMESSLHFLIHKKFLVKEKLSLRSFKNKEFLSSIPFLSYRRPAPHIDEWCALIGMTTSDLDFRYSVDNWTKVGELITMGKGWTLCPRYFMPQSKDVLSVDIPESILTGSPIYLSYSKSLKGIISIENYKN